MGVNNKPKRKEDEELYKKKLTIQVQSYIIAPALPNIKPFKQKKIEVISLCYKEFYKDNPEVEKILETVKHLDRARLTLKKRKSATG